jgi:16S rRNA processing protein RimM
MTDSLAPAVDVAAPADLIEVGHVVEAYGVRGGLKVQPYSTQPDTLLAAKIWWLRKGKETRRATVVEAKRHGATVAATWAGVADRDQAHAWRGWSVLVPRSDFPAPAEGEFYWVDLIGCELKGLGSEGGSKIVLGKVVEVIDNGAHAILRVERVVPEDTTQPLLDAKGKVKEILVPFVDAYVLSVDITSKSIDSDWPADF